MCDEMKNNEIRENEISESTANERPAAETATGEEKSARGKNVFKRFGRGFVNFFKEKGADFKRNHKLKKEQRAKNRAAFKSLTGKQKTKTVCEWLLNHALYILIGIFVLVVFIYNNNFLSFDSIVNITMQSAARLIMALGIAGAIVLTGTDLSAGRCVGLCACICASLLQSSGVMNKMFPSLAYSVWLIPIGLLISMAVGGLVGAFNGFMVSKFKLHPFIVTLGTQLILYGMVMWYVSLGQNNSAPIAGLDQTYIDFIKGGFKIGGVQIPNYLWITVAVTIVMWIIWNKTKLGKNMFAVGTNQEAAAVSGVNVAKTIILVFALAGITYGISGFVESARIASNSTATGVNYELDAIAACVIGGVSFMGGIGKIRGVILGVFLLQIVNAGPVFLEFNPAAQTIVKGAIILFACAMDMRKYIAKK